MRPMLFILGIILNVPGFVNGQQTMDGLYAKELEVERLQKVSNALDSVQHLFYVKADSLKVKYGQELLAVDSSKKEIQLKIDSLQTLKLPTEKYTSKLDSLNKKREQAVASLNESVGKLKSKTVGKINNLELPPELKDKVSSVTKNIDGFQLPVKDLNLHTQAGIPSPDTIRTKSVLKLPARP